MSDSKVKYDYEKLNKLEKSRTTRTIVIPEKYKYLDHTRPKFEKSRFEVIPLNSHVKTTNARFLLKTNSDFDIEQVKIKIHNANELVFKDKDYTLTRIFKGPQGKEININVSKLNPGFYRLYLKVKIEKDKKNEYQYRTSYIDFARFSVETKPPGVELPSPEQNNATIKGIDSDGDGIRDDVQVWINKNYVNQPQKKLAVQQMARTFQTLLTSIDNEELSKEALRRFLDSSICLEVITGFDEETIIRANIKKLYLNTKDRLYAEIKANQKLSGQSYIAFQDIEKKKALCSFNVD